jgi:hypothetical protein
VLIQELVYGIQEVVGSIPIGSTTHQPRSPRGEFLPRMGFGAVLGILSEILSPVESLPGSNGRSG